MIAWSDLRNKIILSVIFGIAIAAVLAMFADLPRTLAALQRFDWRYLPLILGLTLVNYALRFVKWHYYVGQIGAGHVSLGDSLKIFVAGFTMIMTPGKIGEFFKTGPSSRQTASPSAARRPSSWPSGSPTAWRWWCLRRPASHCIAMALPCWWPLS
ncbi:MAG: hypothetical protein MAG451_03108 [Anaerolineales bacterium]|nr:hypothetical protein [Anaerolineales bacterium]